jgi:hypothetical protein
MYGGSNERGGSPAGSDYGFGRGCGRGASEFGGSERVVGLGGSEYEYSCGHGNRGASPSRGRGRGYRGISPGGADPGGFRGRGNRSRGRGVVVEAPAVVGAGSAPADVAVDVVEAGSYPLLTPPTLSSGRTGPLPAQHTMATGVKRRKYRNAGRIIKSRSNHVVVELDQKTWYHYDGLYLSYSREDK